MRIGLITQWYEPETGSAAHPTAIARALHARGHDVQVLTGFPSYPAGRVYPGYRMSVRRHENRDGIRLLRVPDMPSHDDRALRRAASLTSFAVSATVQVGWLRSVDACLVYLTPATVGAAAMALQRLAGVPYILYVQDLWPETVAASGFIGHSGVEARVLRMLGTGLERLYRRADGVAAISPTMAAMLAGRGPRAAPVVVSNWVDETAFRPAPATTDDPAVTLDRSWFMYAGGVGEVQALDHLVRAVALLSDRPDIGVVVVGEGTARAGLEKLARDLGVADRVRFAGTRPTEAMPGLMAAAVAQIVSLRDLPVFRATVPSKVQASMACGAPVLCAVAGDAAELVEREGCGRTVPPEDPAAMAAAMRALTDLDPGERAALGRRGREAYVARLSADAGTARLEQMLLDAAARRNR